MAWVQMRSWFRDDSLDEASWKMHTEGMSNELIPDLKQTEGHEAVLAYENGFIFDVLP